MKFTRKKICIIFCGDIFGAQKKEINEWLDTMPELKIIADFQPIFVFGKKTAGIKPENWLDLAREIHQNREKFDGFVVLHNLDNILYTSSAVSFLLPNFNKPIIFTGDETGIKANLINACQSAVSDLAEVCLMFGNRLLRANCSFRDYQSALNKFNAEGEGVLGRIDFSLRVFKHARKKIDGEIIYNQKIYSNVAVIEVTPFVDFKKLADEIKNRKALIFKINSNCVSDDLNDFVKTLTDKTPVVIFSSDGVAVPVSSDLFLVNNMTIESTVTKLSMLLGDGLSIVEIKKRMAENINGEIIKI